MDRKRVMIVEDEVIVALDIAGYLDQLGYECCRKVDSGEEAVQQAGLDQPDLILMDIGLAGRMDGIEAAENIREKSDIPIVFLTAYIDDRVVERAKKTEPYGYLLKPVSTEALRATIELALYKGSMEEERRRLLAEIQKALEEVKRLSGILPICANCKKIRDDEGYWQYLEKYIQEHSEAQFSHGLCPPCSKKLYPEIFPEE